MTAKHMSAAFKRRTVQQSHLMTGIPAERISRLNLVLTSKW